jgi:hypothetical protein
VGRIRNGSKGKFLYYPRGVEIKNYKGVDKYAENS